MRVFGGVVDMARWLVDFDILGCKECFPKLLI
jgi:hypothetical protein